MNLIRARLDAHGLRTILLGALSLFLYILLFLFEDEVMRLTVEGSFAFLVPIAIALVFSFVHGAFTSGFWDMLGLKAKTRKEPRRWNK